jgi:hypothetical protein
VGISSLFKLVSAEVSKYSGVTAIEENVIFYVLELLFNRVE